MERLLHVCGEYSVRHIRGDRCLRELRIKNAVTNQGKTDLLNGYLGGNGGRSWYFGLISSTGYSIINVADTLASHAGWTEFTDYSGSRKLWTPGAASGNAIDSAADAVFTFTASGTIVGFLVASVSSGTAGILWSSATTTSIAVVASDKVVITSYRVTVA